MRNLNSTTLWIVWTVLAWLGSAATLPASSCAAEAQAEAKTAPTPVQLADGNLVLQAPAVWVKKQPTSTLIEYEFAVPKHQEDATGGRLTIMAAGGSVQQNIDRWVGQFQAPAGGKVEKKTAQKSIAGQQVHLVDLRGTYLDRRGPFAPATAREGYRMLGAIIVTENHGQHFIKLYGPEKTIGQAEKSFQQFVESLSTRK